MIMSREGYYRQDDNCLMANMACGNSRYVKTAWNVTKLQGNPGLRTTCEVLIYIAPPHCSTWRTLWFNGVLPEETSILVPIEIMAITIPGATNFFLEIKGFRTGDFIAVIGQIQIGLVPEEENLLMYLELSKIPTGAPITVPTKLFLPIRENSQGGFEIYTVYLVAVAWAAGSTTGPLDSQNVTYKFDQFDEMPSLPQLYKYIANETHKSETMWIDDCGNCPQRNGFVPKRELTYLTKLSEMPLKEFVFLDLLFPNSSILSGGIFKLYHRRADSFKIFRSSNPINATLLFRPKTSNDGYYFLTCCSVGEDGAFSLTGLVSAYDDYTWIWISLGLVVTPAFLIHILLREKLSDVILNSFSIFLEQGCFENIMRRSKWIGCVCLFMGIILSNTYRGDNITALTAPRPQSKWVRYDELFARNFTFLVTLDELGETLKLFELAVRSQFEATYGEGYSEEMVLAAVKNQFSAMMKPGCEYSLPDTLLAALHGGFVNPNNEVANNIFNKIIWPSGISEFDNFSDNKFFLPRLAKCEREAFIGQRLEVTVMSQILSDMLFKAGEHTQVISVGTEAFSNVAPTWHLLEVNVPAGYLFTRVHLLWQSGFVELWDAWEFRAKSWNSSYANAVSSYQGNLPKALKMSNNVVVVFYLFLALITTSIIVFCKELNWFLILAWFHNKIQTCKQHAKTLNARCRDGFYKIIGLNYDVPYILCFHIS